MAAFSVAVIFIVFFIVQMCSFHIHAKCTIDVNKDYKITSPLILNKKTLDIIYPEKNSPNLLSLKSSEEQLIHCTGGQLTRFNITTESINENSRCIDSLTFENPEKNIDYIFSQIGCSKTPEPITKEESNKKCGKDGIIVNIGYQVTRNNFIKTLDLCYVNNLATTLWSHTRIPSAIGGNKNRHTQIPAFSKGSYFKNVLMSRVYPKFYQKQTFLEIFNGDKNLVDQYFPQEGKKENYFVKGHLVARADMYYYPEQYSTYFYLNVLPMWQSINNGNWKIVESTVRRIANLQNDLDSWTGGIDILKLNGHDIYLTKDKKNQSKMIIPVPKLLFKIVKDRMKKQAMVFLTVNNPHVDEKKLPNEYRICKEYEDCWTKFPQFKKSFEGYTYCCLLGDFLNDYRVKDMKIPIDSKNVKPLMLY